MNHTLFLIGLVLCMAQQTRHTRQEIEEYVARCRTEGRSITFVERFGKENYQLDLSGADLRGVDFRGARFMGMKLCGANLDEADLRDAEFYLGEFQGASLRGADFQGAVLDRCDLSGADLRGAQGVASKRMPSTAIDLKGADLSSTDLRGSDLRNADLENADLSGSDLRGSVLAGANLKGADLEGARLEHVILINARGLQGREQGLSSRGAIATTADLEAAVKVGVDFRKADLSYSNLSGCRLAGAKFEEGWFHSARLDGADLSGARLQKAFFGFGSMERADLGGAFLEGANFSSVKGSFARFPGAKLRGSGFWSATLCGTDFSGADLTEADLHHADLTGAGLKGCGLKGIQVEGAILEGVTGLSERELGDLKSKAGRWKVELAESVESGLKSSFPGLNVLIWLCVVGAFFAARKGLRSRGVFHALSAANAILAASPAALILLTLCGGSPVAQMSGYGIWHLWFSIWPLLILATFGALLVTAATFFYHIVANLITKRRKEYGLFSVYVVPTLLNGLLTLYLLGQAAPDA